MIPISTSSDESGSQTRPVPSGKSPGRQSDAEMDRLRQLIIGDQVDRVEERVADISRQVTSREVRVRRLVEDMPDALSKNAVDQNSLERLATALRSPIEAALHQSVRSDREKVAEIIAPAVGQALPRALLSFVLSLPFRLARRVWRVIWPKSGSRRGSGGSGLLSGGSSQDDRAFQVERICLFQKDSVEPFRVSDLGFDDDTMQLQVDYLFAQLREALIQDAGGPVTGLPYPQLPKKGEAQGMLVLSSERFILGAYYIGKPAAWFRDRMQDLADEADGLAATILQLSQTGQPADQQWQALDGTLKKGLVCYVPQARTAVAHGLETSGSWWRDAAVVASVIAVVWIVASLARASTRWNGIANAVDAEPGIVVLNRSWIPGGSLSGLRDPLAPDPAEILASKGYPRGSVKVEFTPFVSDEAPFREHRQSLQAAERDSLQREISRSYARTLALMEANLSQPASGDANSQPDERRELVRVELLRALLELPPDTRLEIKNGILTIPASLPKATRTRIRETAKSIPWVKEVRESNAPSKTTSSLFPWGTSAAKLALAEKAEPESFDPVPAR